MSGFTVRTIVFPTDFSDCSRHAGERAADVARHFGAALHVLHVDPPVTAPAPPTRVAAAAAALGSGLVVTTATVSGVPAHAICAYARKVGAELIVMGTHGRTGVSRAVLGSVAEAVVRHADCPVMTVPAAEAARVMAESAAAGTKLCCVVCAKPSPTLICEPCRARIRGEALEHKEAEERAGRVGTSR